MSGWGLILVPALGILSAAPIGAQDYLGWSA